MKATSLLSSATTFALQISLGLAGLTLSQAPAAALDLCKAIALQPVAAREDPSAIILKGGYDTTITQFNVDRRTRASSARTVATATRRMFASAVTGSKRST